MDFSWSKDQMEFRHAVVEFAKQELSDDVSRRDRDGERKEEFRHEFDWSVAALIGKPPIFDPDES